MADKAQHTPGPWMYRGPGLMDYRGVFAQIGDKYWIVASVTAGRSQVMEDSVEWEDVRHEAEANACLIAAAPDMLAALQKIADNYGGCHCDHSTEDCCENPATGEFCPHCIAELAINEVRSGETRRV